ncbi:MAG: glycosyltransferase family 9 protein [Daejeonella sp.]
MRKDPKDIMRNNLLVRNPVANAILRIINFILPNSNKNDKIESHLVESILVCNNAHLGDVILSTAVLNALKISFPNARIYFLGGSWSKDIYCNHELISDYFFYDHWKLNRTSKPIYRKAITYFKSVFSLIKQLRKTKIDLAIDLYFYYPNSSFWLWISRVPIRMGYTSGGFGKLYTHAMKWEVKQQTVVDYYYDLLSNFLKQEFTRSLFKPNVTLNSDIKERLNDILIKLNFNQSDYSVVHIGTGLKMKEWPMDNWNALIDKLSQQDFKIFFTGYGSRENELISKLIENRDGCYSLCGELSFLETACCIKQAKFLVCVDSVAAHLGACFDTPTIVIGNGINDNILWRAQSTSVKSIIWPTHCTPCYTGCAEMECVRNITSETVHKNLMQLLKK